MDKEKIFELLEQCEYLPTLPQNVIILLDMLKNPTAVDVDYLVEMVAKEEHLNKILLKGINSGCFHLNRKVETLKEAVIYLGMQAVQNLLIFFITLQLFPEISSKRQRTFDVYKYWKHVLGTSVASCMLSSRLKQGDRYKLFTYGLIHDIGIAVLDVCLPHIIDEVTEKLKMGMHQIVAERIVMGGVTHADIGAWLCRRWNISEDITNIVEFHHTPFLAAIHTDEVKLVHVADMISTEYYEKLLGLNLNHGISNQIMDSLGLTDKDRQYVSNALPGELDKLSFNFFM